MIYPKEFIEKCKKLYPDWTKLHWMLDEGNTFVGRYLDDSSSTSIHINTVLFANSLDELKLKAQDMKEKLNLYKEWCEIYKEIK
jgi:hypothetical protein